MLSPSSATNHAPLQVHILADGAGWVDEACQAMYDRLISFFVEAADQSFSFSKEENLHRLYEKVFAFTLSGSTARRVNAVADLCLTARQAGFAATFIGAPTQLNELAQYKGIGAFEAWLLVGDAQPEEVKSAWNALSSNGASVVIVANPATASRYPFLDDPEVSGSCFRLVSPKAYSVAWPLEFRIDANGRFSRPLRCARTGFAMTSVQDVIAAD